MDPRLVNKLDIFAMTKHAKLKIPSLNEDVVFIDDNEDDKYGFTNANEHNILSRRILDSISSKNINLSELTRDSRSQSDSIG